MEGQEEARPQMLLLDLRPYAGFTFVEVLIVLLIVGLMAMVTIPAMNSSVDDSRLSAATREVVAALEFAQLTAMTSGRECRVTIDDAGETILVEHFVPGSEPSEPEEGQSGMHHGLVGGLSKSLCHMMGIGDDGEEISKEMGEEDVEGGHFEPMEHPMNPGVDYRIHLPDEGGFDGVDITAVDFGSYNSVTFSTLGAPSDGGTVILTLGSRQMVVTVDSMTGKVLVSSS
jgi:prepilin-type N-terminal cleavage/methylation domain-containing protein